MSRTNADLTLELLAEAGVDRIFTCPGTTEVPLLDASLRRESPQFVLTTHETTAVAAADGYSRATGRIGVALLHANVGLTNGLAMVEAARIGRSRVLVLNGTKPVSTRYRRGFTQTAESPAVARPFTVKAASVATHASLPADVAGALQRLHEAPHGPVYLELPQDVLAAPTDRVVEACFRPPDTAPSADAISAAAATLAGAGRVAIVAGSELAGMVPELLAFADTLRAPIFEAPWRELERETVPTDHPAYAGLLSFAAHHLADVTVLVAGTPAFQEPDAGPALLPGSARVVHLLNSSADLIAGALPVVGEYRAALAALTSAVRRSDDGTLHARSAFREDVTAWHRAELAALSAPPGPEASLTVRDVALELGRLPLPGPVVLDAVTASTTLLRLVPRGGDQPYYATGSGALGWGPGAAVGVALAGEHRRVYGLLSDGVLQFGLPALHTAAAERLPITYVVVNNAAYHAVALALEKFGGAAAEAGNYPCTDLGDTNLAAVAAGFGLESARVGSVEDLRAALARFDGQDGPALVEVLVSTADAGNPAR